MLKLAFRLGTSDRGVSAVEFALVAPVLLMTLLGAIDFGRMFYLRQGLEYAAQAGARYYVLNTTAASSVVTAYVQSKMPAGTESSVTVDLVDNRNCSGSPQVTCTNITATISFAFAGFIPIGPMTLRASAQAIRLF